MAKQKNIVKTSKQSEESFLSKFALNNIIPQKHHPWIVILVIFILFLIFLNPLYFGNKTFESGDIITMESMKTYLEKDREGFSLWNPYIFAGMPAYALSTEPTWFNIIYTIYTTIRTGFASLFSVQYAMWSFYLIVLTITSFLLMRYLTKNTLVSLFTALATSFSTGIIVFLYIGHVTKLTSLCMYPLMFLLILRLKEKFTLLDFLLLVVTLQILIQGFHVQIIFYIFFATAIYFIYFLIRHFIKKEKDQLKGLVKAGFSVIFAIIIALLIQSDNFTQIYEYTPYSTRGTESIIEKSNPKTAKSESDYYEYHTEWSFSVGEVLTFIVPSYYGFGNSTYKGPLTNNQPVEVNTYFGQMRFVDVAMYMGILIFFLGIYAMIVLRKNPLVQYLTILVIISLLISFGKNFSIFFDLMFYYFPYFNKFRVPSMILVLIQINLPILAGLGLMNILSLREKKDEKIKVILRNISLGISAVFLLTILLNSAISNWFIERINSYADTLQNSQLAQQYKVLADYTSQMFVTDLIFAVLFLTICSWSIFLYYQRKFSADILILVFIIVTMTDLWRIDSRGAKYIDNPDIKSIFAEPDYVTFIKSQNDKEPFRIFNAKQDGSPGSLNNNTNFHAYFLLEDFYGYSGIKPRAYQDYMDVVNPINRDLWNMLNVKYLITDKPASLPGLKELFASQKSFVYLNESRLPRVFFVDKIENISPLDFLNQFRDGLIDPKRIGIVEGEIPKVDAPDSSANIKILKYDEALIEAEITANGNNFIFIGNTYHPGWKATVNGNETKIFKTNHGFLGLVVPKGNNKVKIEYAPESFFLARNVSLVLSSLVVLGLLLTIILDLIRKKKNQSIG